MEFYYDGEWFKVSVKAADTIPVGAIVEFPSLTAPYGYLLCDGRAVSRTEYADLFAAIGTTHGAGDGSTTFNLPTRKGRNAVGYDPNDTDYNAIGKTGGEKKHILTVNEMPSHFHGGIKVAQNYLGAWNNEGTGNTFELSSLFTQLKGEQNKFVTEETGGGQAHNIVSPYQVSAFYIKYTKSIGVLANTKNETTTSEEDTYSCNYINNMIKSDFDTTTNIGYTKFPDGTCMIYGFDHNELVVGGNNANVKDYTYPFTLANTNYSCTISKWDGGNGFSFVVEAVALKSTTGFRIYAYNNNSNEAHVSGYMWQVMGKWK